VFEICHLPYHLLLIKQRFGIYGIQSLQDIFLDNFIIRKEIRIVSAWTNFYQRRYRIKRTEIQRTNAL